jgi:hypothetical protein
LFTTATRFTLSALRFVATFTAPFVLLSLAGHPTTPETGGQSGERDLQESAARVFRHVRSNAVEVRKGGGRFGQFEQFRSVGASNDSFPSDRSNSARLDWG